MNNTGFEPFDELRSSASKPVGKHLAFLQVLIHEAAGIGE
jgi:hypothetical protein